MAIDLVGESLKFMILGMSIVFVFLIVLVQVMKLQAYLVGKFFADEEKPAATSGSNQESGEHVAAIVAAISEYRKNN